MLMGIIIILFAWFIEMPTWLSVLATVFGGLRIITKFTIFISKLIKACEEEESKE